MTTLMPKWAEAAPRMEHDVAGDTAPRELPIEQVQWRDIVRIEGQIRSIRVRPWATDTRTLECTVVDPSGGVELVFLGRAMIPGIRLGGRIRAEGRVGVHHRRLVLLNPVYDLVAD